MTPSAFRSALTRVAKRRPFQPFVIEFVTGQQLTVRHPEAVEFGRILAAFISPTRQVRLFDSFSVCQLLEIMDEPPINLRDE
jgi:hypothetical protein